MSLPDDSPGGGVCARSGMRAGRVVRSYARLDDGEAELVQLISEGHDVEELALRTGAGRHAVWMRIRGLVERLRSETARNR